ncbi:hypothetical protein Pint_01171 [Pistacia integerrima]|uniref:Uncharacterized protein n=1 Tax=Pistacia integerrima TaxID=434235 RepID=A0ACC0ZJ51_9ROSI|nr:hypothetical protein Pint_01171 [Pistacia integerrima]
MKYSIVIYPSPGRGHLVSMIELAKLILTHYPSFYITVIIPEAPFETGVTYGYVQSISATVPSITFHHLPTIPTTTSLLDIQTQTFELSLQNNHNFHQALVLISKSSNIKALLLDFFCNPSFKISAKLEILTYYYKPGGPSGLTVFLYLPTIHKNTTKSLKELGNEEINIPGMPVPLRAKDMPYPMQDRTWKVYDYFLETAIQMPRSAGIIVNTVETLEKTALNAILDGQCTPGEPAPPEDDGLVSAEEFEKLVTKLIDSNDGKLIKERVMALKEKVSVALKEGGPSLVALANLIESILKH